jgi:hypothetical protein
MVILSRYGMDGSLETDQFNIIQRVGSRNQITLNRMFGMTVGHTKNHMVIPIIRIIIVYCSFRVTAIDVLTI